MPRVPYGEDESKQMTNEDEWFSRPRSQKLAACMYPNLVDAQTQQTMKSICQSTGVTDPLTARAREAQAYRDQATPKRRR